MQEVIAAYRASMSRMLWLTSSFVFSRSSARSYRSYFRHSLRISSPSRIRLFRSISPVFCCSLSFSCRLLHNFCFSLSFSASFLQRISSFTFCSYASYSLHSRPKSSSLLCWRLISRSALRTACSNLAISSLSPASSSETSRIVRSCLSICSLSSLRLFSFVSQFSLLTSWLRIISCRSKYSLYSACRMAIDSLFFSISRSFSCTRSLSFSSFSRFSLNQT